MTLSDWKFWFLILGAGAALILTLMNVARSNDLREQQAEILQRQQFINQSVQLSQFNSQFIQALAQLAAQTNDESITAVLAENGVTFSVKPRQEPQAEENQDE